jgi:phosphoribosylformylglycinamidine synthase
LNFGNPEKPTGFWQFRRAVEGIAAATEAFGTPVVSGNVSFYNETPDAAIFPTPVIGMLGILEDVNRRCGSAFRDEGDILIMLRADSDPTGGLGGSEYLSVIHKVEAGAPPSIDLAGEHRLHQCVVAAIQEGLIASAHDCSDGGLAVCLAESAIGGGMGAAALLRYEDFGDLPPSAVFFGETQSRIVVSVRTDKQLKRVEQLSVGHGIRATWLGTVGGDALRIAVDGEDLLNEPIAEIAELYRSAIGRIMNREN